MLLSCMNFINSVRPVRHGLEQVKGHAMAGSTLTDDFWANDILWQLSVFAYNISVMMRQKKNKFKKQEHRTFIDLVHYSACQNNPKWASNGN